MRPGREIIAAFALAATACAGSPAPAGGSPGDAGVVDAGDAGPHALCRNGVSVDGAYPRATYGFTIGKTLPDLAFDVVGPAGEVTASAMHDTFEPCAAQARLLVVRVGAGWCGTCRWSVERLAAMVDAESASRLVWLDVLLRDDDNGPPTADFAKTWIARSSPPGRTAIDPGMTFGRLGPERTPLPYLALVDTRTMEIRFVVGDFDPGFIVDRIAQELAALDGKPAPAHVERGSYDGTFNQKSWDLLHDMTLPGAPASDPTNARADDSGAAALGRSLFSDKRLSPSETVSCATCHDPEKHFSDGLTTSVGVDTGDRNAPSVLLASHARWQFWDGRADTLWAQATGPFENSREFNSSRLFVAHAISDHHAEAYVAVFGALPPLQDRARFPSAGKPGDAPYDAMSASDRAAVTGVLANVGKAIAAFERTLRVKPNRLDAYLGGQLDALTPQEKSGAATFFSAGCAQCHYGPRLTDDAFHAVRFPTGRRDGQPDRGRELGVPLLLASAFRADGPFSDAPTTRAAGVAGAWTTGAFKTPALRGVSTTAPYGHGGSLATLRDVVVNYGQAGLPLDDPRAVGATEPWVPQFSPGHVDDLVRFLEVLEAEPESP